MADGFNTYDHKQQLSHGVWVVNKGNKEWGDEMNRNMEILNDLVQPGTLTIKDSEDAVLVEYNGNTDKVLVLPEQELPDLKTLTIKNDDGSILATYNGSEDTLVVIRPQGTTPEPQEIKALTIKNEEGETLAVYDGSEEKEVIVGNTAVVDVEFEDNEALDFIFE